MLARVLATTILIAACSGAAVCIADNPPFVPRDACPEVTCGSRWLITKELTSTATITLGGWNVVSASGGVATVCGGYMLEKSVGDDTAPAPCTSPTTNDVLGDADSDNSLALPSSTSCPSTGAANCSSSVMGGTTGTALRPVYATAQSCITALRSYQHKVDQTGGLDLSHYLDTPAGGCDPCVHCGDDFAGNIAWGFGIGARSIAFEKTGDGDMSYSLVVDYTDDVSIFGQSRSCDVQTGLCAGTSITLNLGLSIHFFSTTVTTTPTGGSPTTVRKQGLIGRSDTSVVRLGEFTDSSFTPVGSSTGPISGTMTINVPITGVGTSFALDDETVTDSFQFDCDINRDGVVDWGDCTVMVSLIGVSLGSADYNPRADFNLSGSITTTDGGLMRSLLNTALGGGITYGDLDSDNDVDCSDAIIASAAWGSSYPSGSYRVELDYDLNGVLDASDKGHFDAVCSCTTGAPTCGAGWIGGTTPPSTSTIVRATLAWDPDGTGGTGVQPALLVCAFSNGGTSAVATWNGASWATLASGISGTVDALGVDASGALCAGGSFSSIGGVSANNIGRWTGTTWAVLGTGTNARVRAIYVDGTSGSLAVGGDFTAAGGSAQNYLAEWSGSSWSGIGSGTNGAVYTLGEDSNGYLLAGGAFTSAGGGSIGRGIAVWDGSSWSGLGSGVDNNTVTAVALLTTGDVVAGGTFTSIGSSSSKAYVARWDGSGWNAMSNGFNAPVSALLALPSGKLAAGGSFTSSGTASFNHIARWTGSAWTTLGGGVAGTSSEVLALARVPTTEIVAGGVFSIAGGVAAENLGRWSDTGKAWIAMQPVKGVAVSGSGNATLSAAAAPGYDYAGALSYQWRHGATNISNGSGGASTGGGTVTGSTSASMTIAGVASSDHGSYTVRVTNGCGYVDSSAGSIGTSCPADQNHDGTLNIQDLFDFLSDWFALCTATGPGCYDTADFNADFTTDVQDIFDYLSAWFAGCT